MEDEREHIRKPVSAYITFNTVEGSSRANDLLKEKSPQGIYPKLFGFKIDCKRADNPSDIRWENKQVRFRRLLLRSLCFAGVIMLILYLTQILVVYPLLMRGQATIDVLPPVE